MPFALIVALAASLGAHAFALFVPDLDLGTSSEPAPLQVEIVMPPKPAPVAEVKRDVKPAPAVRAKPRHKAHSVNAAPASTPVLNQDSAPAPAVATGTPPPPAEEATPLPAPPPVDVAPPRLPAHGMVRYTVFRGDQGLMIGRASHEWRIADHFYRIATVVETAGLAALLKPLRIEQESRGTIDAEGLKPTRLTTRRNGVDSNEKAELDWAAGRVRIGTAETDQALDAGAQDIVSFPYQLGWLPLAAGLTLPVVTGKKAERYRLDNLGEEMLATPAGNFRTLHLRAPGDNTTELWLALDRLLLPVKIRHTDKRGDSFEQVAVEILTEDN